MRIVQHTRTLFRLVQVLGPFGGAAYLFQRYCQRGPSISVRPKGGLSPLSLRRNSTDLIVFHQIFLWGDLKFPVPGTPKVIFDLGAYVGLSCVYFALRFPEAKIIAVEPSDRNLAALRPNVAAYSQIVVVEAAIAGQSGTATIVDEDSPEHSFRYVREEAASLRKRQVRALSINDLMTEAKVEVVDVLKMDIEGAEMDVFASRGDEWTRHVRCVAVEIHDGIAPGATREVERALLPNFVVSRSGEYSVFTRKEG